MALEPEPLREPSTGGAYSVGQARSGRRLRHCGLIVQCVGALLVTSAGLAYASPPDPSWIHGIYDDRDYDDIVAMVTGGAGVNNAEVPQLVTCLLVAYVLRVVIGRLPKQTARGQTIRGPPHQACDASANRLLICLQRSFVVRQFPSFLPRPESCAAKMADFYSPQGGHCAWRQKALEYVDSCSLAPSWPLMCSLR